MRIVQAIASVRLDHGGTSRSVPSLCNALVELGIDNHLVTALPADSTVVSNFPKDKSRVHTAQESARLRSYGIGKQFRSLLSQLVESAHGQTMVHDHGIWLASNHAVASYCNRKRLPRVVSPRGMLGNWAMAHGGWKKQLAWHLYQRKDLRTATAFHATSEQEATEIRSHGFQQPIVVIPNGVEVPNNLPGRKAKPFRQALFLSRLHPKKGLINLIRAWHSVSDATRDWKLVIAGPDEAGHRHEVELEVAKLNLAKSVEFVGNVEGEAKWQLYVDSDLFVLPSFNENFGIVIAEALALGLPVITTKSTPWEVIQVENLGWWIENNIETLSSALRDALGLPATELKAMGARALEAMKTCFSWQAVAKKHSEFYRTLQNRSDD